MHLCLIACLLHAAFQLLGHPGVETLARKGCSEVDPPVKGGADAGDELAGERLLRFFPALLAECKIILDGIVERLAQLGDAGALERDDIPSIDDFAVKHPGRDSGFSIRNFGAAFRKLRLDVCQAGCGTSVADRAASAAVSYNC